jgi:hypothetical protein
MLTSLDLLNQKKTSGQQPTKIQRRTLIGGAMGAFLASSGRLLAQDEQEQGPVHNPFILLLKGIYQPVALGQGPRSNLGLTTVNLSDGSYSKTRIYPVYGIPESREQSTAIGTFYVQFAGNLCAYDLPGGSIAMSFNDVPQGAPPGFNGFVPFPDGSGGFYLEGTFELVIHEATGLFRAFKGGHNHMVDRLHQLASGSFDEFCFCNISQYPFP